MSSRLGSLALCAALAAARVSAASLRTPTCTPNNFKVLEVTVPNFLMRALAGLPSAEAAEAARFLKGHLNIPLVIACSKDDEDYCWPRPVFSDDGVLALYDVVEKRFMVSHDLLHWDGQNEEALIKSPETFEVLALEAAPTFVHEISHAREAEVNAGYVPHILEDEFVAYYREFLFLLDMLSSDPRYDKLGEALALQRQAQSLLSTLQAGGDSAARAKAKDGLKAAKSRYDSLVTEARLGVLYRLNTLRRSNREFEAGIQSDYPDGVPSLWDDPRERAQKADKQISAVETVLADHESKLAAMQPGSPEWERARDRKRHLSDLLADLKGGRQFWGDQPRVEQARSHYARLLGELRRHAEAARISRSETFGGLAVDPPGLVETRLSF